MNQSDPNILSVELVAEALGGLAEELVLVGGCSVGLLITDQARPPVRQTLDVDLVAEVVSKNEYYILCDKLKSCGFKESADADHICRWHKGSLILDVMPSEESVLGHSTNRWYPQAVQNADRLTLNTGRTILVISPPLFLATKLEAFYGRAAGDYGHHDMEDIINVVDGRPEIVNEVATSSDEVRKYLRDEFDELLAEASFTDDIPRHFRPDQTSQARVPIVIDRLRQLAGL
jgi:predicted nucleotidyltransferase